MIRSLEVANIDAKTGGGALRAYNILRYRSSTGVDCRSLLLGFTRDKLRGIVDKCPPVGLAGINRIIEVTPLPRSFKSAFSPFQISLLRSWNTDVVISHHETIESLRVASRLAEVVGATSVAVLQLPPFYGNTERLAKIRAAIQAWYELVSAYKPTVGDFIERAYFETVYNVWSTRAFYKLAERILRRFDLVIAASPSIPVEMGGYWARRVLALRPGYGFDVGELRLLRELRARRKPEKSYAVFPARQHPAKGLIDLLIALKLIAREKRDFKLAVMGSGDEKTRRRLLRIASQLGVRDNIVLLDYVERLESFKLRCNAKLTLYPSHVDSYSYTVAESLLMGVPVVAYDIPALKLNYEGVEGLELVREGDVEALAQRVLEVLEAPRVEVGEPRVKTHLQVALEEAFLIRRFLEGRTGGLRS